MDYIACVFLKEGIADKQPSPLAAVNYHCLESGIEYLAKHLDKGISNLLVFGSTDN